VLQRAAVAQAAIPDCLSWLSRSEPCVAQAPTQRGCPALHAQHGVSLGAHQAAGRDKAARAAEAARLATRGLTAVPSITVHVCALRYWQAPAGLSLRVHVVTGRTKGLVSKMRAAQAALHTQVASTASCGSYI